MAPTDCPVCGQPLDETQGRSVRCPTCDGDVGAGADADAGRHPLDDWDRSGAPEEATPGRDSPIPLAGRELAAAAAGALLAVTLVRAATGEDRRRLVLVAGAAIGALAGVTAVRARP